MNYVPLILLAVVTISAGVAYVAHLVGNSRRSNGRPMLRSIPAGLEQAKRLKHRVLVAFVSPGEMVSDRVARILAEDRSLERRLRTFDLVKIAAHEDGDDVVRHIAAKYGLATLAFPTLLVLDIEAKRLASVEGGVAFGESDDSARERIAALLQATEVMG